MNEDGLQPQNKDEDVWDAALRLVDERPASNSSDLAGRTERPSKPEVFETAIESYRRVKQIGNGANGNVFEVEAISDGMHYALKLLSPAAASNATKKKRFVREAKFTQRVDCEAIVRTLDMGFIGAGKEKRPFFVMELCNCSLADLMKDDEVDNVRVVLPMFLKMLAQLRGFYRDGQNAHRDIKPQNILYDKKHERLLLADFGIAHLSGDFPGGTVETKETDRLANFAYAAPEQRKKGSEVDQRTDQYAFGLILNELFTGEVLQGSGYKTIGDIDEGFAYLDTVVAKMTSQQIDDRYRDLDEVLLDIETLGEEHAARHGLVIRGLDENGDELPSGLTQSAVVPLPKLSDAAIRSLRGGDPPQLKRRAFGKLLEEAFKALLEWRVGTSSVCNGGEYIDLYLSALPYRDSILSVFQLYPHVGDGCRMASDCCESFRFSLNDSQTDGDVARVKRTILHELLIYLAAITLEYNDYEAMGQVIGRDYLQDKRSGQKGSLGLFYSHDDRLEDAVKKRDGHEYYSAMAKFWLDHLNGEACRRESFILADELCYNVTILKGKTVFGDHWFPKTYVYDGGLSIVRGFADRLHSLELVPKVARSFGFVDMNDFVQRYSAVEDSMRSGAFRNHGHFELGYNAPLLCQFVPTGELGTEV